MSQNTTQLTVLIPVRNETLNLKVMLNILQAVLDYSHEVLVVYDLPEDPCVEIISEMQGKYPYVRAIYNDLAGGVANALRKGVAEAASERILIFAADEVGPVLAVDDMMKLMDDGAEFVSCTRYAFGGRRLGGSLIGHFLSYTANKLLLLISSVALTDSTTGIKMFRRNDFPDLTKYANSVGWAIAFEMAINAQILKLKLGEVPIISIDRLFGGKSTFKVFQWVKGYLNFFFMAFIKLPRSRKKPEVSLRVPVNIVD